MRLRTKLMLVALALSTVAAAPYTLNTAKVKTRVTCPTNGISTATTTHQGDSACYLISCATERCCHCFGATTCGDSTISGVCLYPGEHIEYATVGAEDYSCYSAGGAGIGELVPVVAR